jgi:CheY-like chemotaxis protein
MILKGWKDIAKYLGCGVRTVQRWEKLGMPVRRPTKSSRSAALAMSEEIDAWVKHCSRSSDDSASSDVDASQSRSFRYRILLADDDESLLIALGARLYQAGYDVRTARDGFEALAVMGEAVPDLLVSDLRMPNMSGFELCSVVRQRFPSVAVIAYTGEFVSAGNPILLCDRIIAKDPKSSFELVDAIEGLLSQSPLRTQPAKLTALAVWVPRSANGYFVLTCHECLRSFSVLTCDGVIGEDAVAKCFYCGMDVRYHIDDSVLPIKDDLAELMRYSTERIASKQAIIQRSKQMRESAGKMQRLLRKHEDERNARAAARQNRIGRKAH